MENRFVNADGGSRKSTDSRPEMLMASLVVLMNSYCQCRCARLAGCVLRHLDCIVAHPEADPVLRQTAQRLQLEWRGRAEEAACPLPMPLSARPAVSAMLPTGSSRNIANATTSPASISSAPVSAASRMGWGCWFGKLQGTVLARMHCR